MFGGRKSGYLVATREGGVDRHAKGLDKVTDKLKSPPARVAWIETKP